jgi:hypothetical protein
MKFKRTVPTSNTPVPALGRFHILEQSNIDETCLPRTIMVSMYVVATKNGTFCLTPDILKEVAHQIVPRWIILRNELQDQLPD